jgi:outer membrane protein assembly factor BamD
VRAAPLGAPPPRLARQAAAFLCASALAAILAGCGASVLPAVHGEPERLALARRAFQNRQWSVAVELLKGYIENNAGGADVDQAVELLGETYLRQKSWGEAQVEFERLLRDYPESDSAGAASYHLGEALWGQARGPDFDQEYTEKALTQWQSYLNAYPGHWLNARGETHLQLARARLAKKLADSGTLYLKLKRIDPARLYFGRVLDEYADTPAAVQAQLGLALADARQGKREQAIEELREVQTRFPHAREAREAARELKRLERHASKKK